MCPFVVTMTSFRLIHHLSSSLFLTLSFLVAAYTVGCLSMIFDAVGVGHCAWLVYFITRNLWLVHIQLQHQHQNPLSYHLPLPVIHIYLLSSYILLLVCSCKAAEKHDVDTEAPAQADTKPQIVRVNSGNTTFCNTIVIQTHIPS